MLSFQTFETEGALRVEGALLRSLDALERALVGLPENKAGHRIRGCLAIQPFLGSDGCLGAIAAKALGANARPVRAILFDKSSCNNWSLGWHQDRTICVKHRRKVAGFGPWTVKQGMHHVAPPADVLSRMVTMRVHLDDVTTDNAPLLIAPGSHLLGRVPEDEIEAVVEKCGSRPCLARAGDVWLYSTPILHASARASVPSRRRVLQVDYAAHSLRGGLDWLGV